MSSRTSSIEIKLSPGFGSFTQWETSEDIELGFWPKDCWGGSSQWNTREAGWCVECEKRFLLRRNFIKHQMYAYIARKVYSWVSSTNIFCWNMWKMWKTFEKRDETLSAVICEECQKTLKKSDGTS